ncbi:phosphoribosylformylglycinamidine synthase [Wenzhouxiangella limi]|uniref:Phosphoribosylformylglycinamidine synthase n=1 Tax=Wenzhouxiangella limi TaxID=2707351 RepID=A0A845UYK9_9GAMM|nr:phosphoribosylformylglycinamidine synthase [Wenzhouxiangella limi]NDY94960.1 phosphoribosylformylglycinamidine synthase [Wenzhouxiangella limi]
MIFLLGPDALPGFRRRQLADSLSQTQGCRIDVAARELFLLDVDRLSADDEQRLGRLLHARPWRQPDGADQALLVMPRAGTRTPWASKAADILRRCQLPHLAGIERAQLLSFEGIEVHDLSESARQALHDRMTQTTVAADADLSGWFAQPDPAPLGRVELGQDPVAALTRVNQALGLALSVGEIDYLVSAYQRLARDPTDAELMMFAQANSEHCRHKIFNASWTVDGQAREPSLFGLIRRTHARTPQGTLVAYDDNAAIMEGFAGQMLLSRADDPVYRTEPRAIHIQIKVETHNHPTAISPDPGAATGAGGEIRDETATGRGGRPVAALTGFSVSDLRIPNALQPWETAPEPPDRLASALEIMRDGPIGAARFNNEFGRPALLGYFRSFSARVNEHWWGYHKPIMLAGGSGMIAGGQTEKQPLRAGDRIIVLGGPAMLIGLGGGAASSMSSGQSDAELDYASVQRGNPEMQRRCQEVIDRCWALGKDNPIRSIHDVGAGGLSNALPELLHDGGVGGQLDLRAIPSADPGLSPMAIWCNEAQERYVLAIAPENRDRFALLCERERCPWADLGPATDQGRLHLADPLLGAPAVDMDLELLLGRPPSMHRDAVSAGMAVEDRGLDDVDLDQACDRVLALPTVGSKQFLITIGDRSVGGLSVRDQMVGPWQVPVADQAIVLSDYEGLAGAAMSLGERTPLAIWDAAAAARMAVGEAITNLGSALVPGLERVKLSANWMAAAGSEGQDAALREAVEAASEFCCRLGLAIPVGKDSLSMQTVWHDGDQEQRMRAPVSLIVSAFAPVEDVRRHLTPQLMPVDSRLVLIDLGKSRLGGSALAQVLDRPLGALPDIEDADCLGRAFEALQGLIREGLALACHDRSDGGLFVCALEMALAGRVGVRLELAETDGLPALFNEELGWLVQVPERRWPEVEQRLAEAGLAAQTRVVGQTTDTRCFEIQRAGEPCFYRPLTELAQAWSQTSYRMQRLRDHPECADEEYAALADPHRPGLGAELCFDAAAAPSVAGGAKPRVAILREQGVNGQREMAQAFMAAGFEAVDVHMSDLETGRQTLAGFRGLVACGGFSFGDVLGAGQGWARSILYNPALAEAFQSFFADPGRFALGVCNGCQMLSGLRSIIPGAQAWPDFVHNRSRQFEARLSQVRIEPSPSLFFAGMEGSRLPIVTAHGEGRADFGHGEAPAGVVALRYVDGHGQIAQSYPDNPNGSPAGITGLSNQDGRVTILMPHPERLLRAVNFSWAPAEWGERSPWMRMFHNARQWVATA